MFDIVLNTCSGYHYCTTSLTKPELRFCAGSQRVRDSPWWGSLTMAPAGNKAKCLLPVNHMTKTIHHHHHLHHNCSVICTVTLCSVLHQTHSEFWQIQHSCFFRYIHAHAYPIIFRVIEAYSHIRHIQAYSGIFSTMCNPRIFATLPYSEA